MTTTCSHCGRSHNYSGPFCSEDCWNASLDVYFKSLPKYKGFICSDGTIINTAIMIINNIIHRLDVGYEGVLSISPDLCGITICGPFYDSLNCSNQVHLLKDEE